MNAGNQGIVQIGEFSYFPSQIAGKGATGLVYKGTLLHHDRVSEYWPNASSCEDHKTLGCGHLG